MRAYTLALKHVYNIKLTYTRSLYTRKYTHRHSQERYLSNVCMRALQLCLYTSTINFVYMHYIAYTHLKQKRVYTQFLSECMRALL